MYFGVLKGQGSWIFLSTITGLLHLAHYSNYTLENKVEIWKIKAAGSADRDVLVIYSGHG